MLLSMGVLAAEIPLRTGKKKTPFLAGTGSIEAYRSNRPRRSTSAMTRLKGPAYLGIAA
jgi:hypothetical protein